MWPPAPAPRSSSNLTAVVVVLVIVILVALAGVAAVLLGRQISVTPPSLRVMGVVVARSADGTNWTLTITSVPTVTDPLPGGLSYVSAAGAGWSFAEAGGTVTATHAGPVAVGDRLLLSTTTYSTGYTYQISDSTSILAAGMLR